MELILLPHHKADPNKANDTPEGMVHPEGVLCPFALDSYPRATTCCSLDGDKLREDFKAFCMLDMVEILSLDGDLDVDLALALGPLLRHRVRSIEKQYQCQVEWNRGRLAELLDLRTGRLSPWPSEPVERMTSMRAAADWFEKVGRLGFGVHRAR